jgi:hypothetical protein
MAEPTASPEPMIVRVGKGNVLFPRDCCCCGAPADHDTKIERKKTIPLGIARITRTVTLSVPVCATCGRNVRWHAGMDNFVTNTILLAILMLMVGMVVGAIVTGIAGLGRTSGETVSWIIAFAIMALWLYRRYRKYVARPIEGHLCANRAPVAISGFDAETTTLAFRNFDYGRKVAAMNESAATAAAQPA